MLFFGDAPAPVHPHEMLRANAGGAGQPGEVRVRHEAEMDRQHVRAEPVLRAGNDAPVFINLGEAHLANP